jgi:hypothetical protein
MNIQGNTEQKRATLMVSQYLTPNSTTLYLKQHGTGKKADIKTSGTE